MGLATLLASIALSGAASGTDLRISVWPEGPDEGGPRVWRVRCSPPGGTLPDARAACRRLFLLQQPFAPVRKDVGCTQIYGGPQVARVTGTFRDRRVWATFTRTDGCEIARWNRHRVLFPVRT